MILRKRGPSCFLLDSRLRGNERTKKHPALAGGQEHEVRYESRNTGKSAGAVKRAVKKGGQAARRSNES
jgi:hypothetical protein